MKRIGLVVNCSRKSALECAALATVYLKDMGASVTAEEDAAGSLRVPPFEGAETPEAVLSLGGLERMVARVYPLLGAGCLALLALAWWQNRTKP